MQLTSLKIRSSPLFLLFLLLFYQLQKSSNYLIFFTTCVNHTFVTREVFFGAIKFATLLWKFYGESSVIQTPRNKCSFRRREVVLDVCPVSQDVYEGLGNFIVIVAVITYYQHRQNVVRKWLSLLTVNLHNKFYG